MDDLQESHERLRVDSAAEIRKLKREMKEGVKAMDLESTRAAEATDEVYVGLVFFRAKLPVRAFAFRAVWG